MTNLVSITRRRFITGKRTVPNFDDQVLVRFGEEIFWKVELLREVPGRAARFGHDLRHGQVGRAGLAVVRQCDVSVGRKTMIELAAFYSEKTNI